MSDCDCCFYSGCKCVGGDKEPGDKDKADAERWRKLERLLKSKRFTLIETVSSTTSRHYQHPSLENLDTEIDSIEE